MVTDRGLHELSGVDGLSYEDLFSYQNTMDSSSSSSPQNTLNAHKLGRKNPNNSNSYPISGSSSNGNNPNNSNSSASHESDSPEDSDMFSDIVLSYISRMLMEEDVDEKINSFYQEKSAIQAAEKPFYDILGEEYPPPSPVPRILDALESPGESWVLDSSEKNRFFDPSAAVPDLLIDSQSACQFKRGMEEARKFLPSESKLVVDLGYDQNEKPTNNSIIRSRGKKNTQIEDLDLQEGRSIKQSAVSSDDVVVRSQMFDDVLLCQGAKKTSAAAYKTNDQQEISQKGSSKGRRKKQQKKDVVDLRTLLIHCAQSVAADDRRNSNDLLNQIRQYSSPYGDGTQRLAHCFADGLEARLAGTGSQIYHSLVAKRTTATDTLKAYRLYLSACPFKKISHFFSNQTILNASENRSTVHIIDFGIYFGFQWPCLIQRLSNRPGGPPKLRITGIDVPQPGFRPTERIEETGKRLADYAKSFDVPFEFNAIASKWETIRVEDLKVEEHEVLIVNCLYRFRNLVDETVVADSPRNKVLGMIRKANPDVFIHGIVNGSYSAPFFVTRFREALFHFSALFDMLENTVPREDAQRLLIERDLFGREALNVVSCEGSQRVERPETHKQWQVRNLRAGFTQLPLNPEIMKRAKDKVRASYHRDFVIDEDSRWLLQGWKGRIIYAISAWKPSEKW